MYFKISLCFCNSKFCPAVVVPRPPQLVAIDPSAALITLHPRLATVSPLLVNRFPNKLASTASNKMPVNPPFPSFVSFSIVSLVPFIIQPEYSRDLTIFIISSFPSFEIINVAVRCANLEGRPKLRIFFLIFPASAFGVTAVYPYGIKTILVNGLTTFFTKGKSTFING